MLLMNSTNPSIMVSTTKPQRSPSLHDYIHQNLKSLTISSSLNNPSRNMSDLIATSSSKPRISSSNHTYCLLPYIAVEEDREAKQCDNRDPLFGVQVTTDGTGGCRGGDGRICRGGGNDADYHHNDGTDAYYQSMIEANPENSLILGNYAKYLKEVRGDFTKAKEYCSRSILIDPNDGSVLSMYAYLIWETQNDATSAESYFEQAVKASPHDCHVLASYAGFLWDAE